MIIAAKATEMATGFVIGGNSFHSSQVPFLRVNASIIRTMLTMMATPVRAGTALSARTCFFVSSSV